MAITETGYLPDSGQDPTAEIEAGFLKTRYFHYPNFKVGPSGGKVTYELKVIGRLVDFDPDFLWSVLWSGNTPRTMIGDKLEALQDTDATYPSRIDHKLHLTVGDLDAWLILPTGKRTQSIKKDSMIAALTSQNQALQTQIAELTKLVAELTAKMPS